MACGPVTSLGCGGSHGGEKMPTAASTSTKPAIACTVPGLWPYVLTWKCTANQGQSCYYRALLVNPLIKPRSCSVVAGSDGADIQEETCHVGALTCRCAPSFLRLLQVASTLQSCLSFWQAYAGAALGNRTKAAGRPGLGFSY